MALLAGAFWYELVGFGHKPMTEFVATVPLMGLLALCTRTDWRQSRGVWIVACLAVLTAAIRMQYAPVAIALLGTALWLSGRRWPLVLATAAIFGAVGIFDALTWGGGLFHSYLVNLRYNLISGGMRAGESPAYQFLLWFAIAGGGLSVLAFAAGLSSLRRYGFLLALCALVLLPHSLQSHKEYRFAFAVIPLWLLIGSDVLTRFAAAASRSRLTAIGAAGLFGVASLAGILNVLPFQGKVYRSWSNETGVVGFVRGQDPIFAAYRHLARSPDVRGIWQVDRAYYNLPGYYYLHRAVPFYDGLSGPALLEQRAALPFSVSHILTGNPEQSWPGFSTERDFGGVRILRRDRNEASVRTWRDYSPTIVAESQARRMQRIAPQIPPPPEKYGIRFADRDPQPGVPSPEP